MGAKRRPPSESDSDSPSSSKHCRLNSEGNSWDELSSSDAFSQVPSPDTSQPSQALCLEPPQLTDAVVLERMLMFAPADLLVHTLPRLSRFHRRLLSPENKNFCQALDRKILYKAYSRLAWDGKEEFLAEQKDILYRLGLAAFAAAKKPGCAQPISDEQRRLLASRPMPERAHFFVDAIFYSLRGKDTAAEECLPFIVAYVNDNYKSVANESQLRGDWEKVDGLLRQQPLYAEAEKLWTLGSVNLRIGQPARFWWTKLACLLILYSAQADHEMAFHCLRGLTRTADDTETAAVMGVAYVVAMLLLGCHRLFGVSDRLHYNLHSALAFLDDEGAGIALPDEDAQAQRKREKAEEEGQGQRMTLTAEQRRVVGMKLGPVSRGVRATTHLVTAFAGTGKTRTLISLIQANPDKHFLLLMFNKAAQEECDKKLKTLGIHNVLVATTHSFAYNFHFNKNGVVKAIGTLFGRLNKGELLPYKLEEFFHNRKFTGEDLNGALTIFCSPYAKGKALNLRDSPQQILSRLVVKTIGNWCDSEADALCRAHVPVEFFSLRRPDESSAFGMDPLGSFQSEPSRGALALVTDRDQELVLNLSRLFWEAMIEMDMEKRIQNADITHSGYLKYFLLQNVDISDPDVIETNLAHWKNAFDAILVDEAQDLNPALLKFLFAQSDIHKVFVGDPHQSIYGWRGAVNALNLVSQREPDAVRLPLTRSFRFGPAIAYLANSWLWRHCGEQTHFLLGSRLAGNLGSSLVEGEPLTIVGRLNLTLLWRGARLASANPSCSITFLGGLSNTTARLDEILEIHFAINGELGKLRGRNSKSKYEKWIGQKNGMLKSAKDNMNFELVQRIQFADWTNEIQIELLRICLERGDPRNGKMAPVPGSRKYMLSTVHGCKMDDARQDIVRMCHQRLILAS